MDEEIKKLIEANMPQQVGDVLKKRLVQADEDARTVPHLKGLMEKDSQKIRDLEKEIARHKSLDDRTNAIEKRESEVTAREVRQELLTAKADAAISSKKDIFDLVSLVFRNPKFVRSEYVSESVPVTAGQYGVQSSAGSKSTNVTEEIQ